VQVEHEGESEQVHNFKFLGSYKSADGDCTKEIKRRIALARQKAVVLASIWKGRNIKTATKVKVMKSMVWAVFQYGVEGWTLKKSDRNRIEAFEMWCWRKMLSISWQEHRTNDSVLTELGLERELMGRVASEWLPAVANPHRGRSTSEWVLLAASGAYSIGDRPTVWVCVCRQTFSIATSTVFVWFLRNLTIY